jgi:hypothetical protein
MRPSPAASSGPDTERLGQSPVSVGRYGVIVLLGLILTLSVLAALSMIAGIAPQKGLDIVGLPIAIYFSNWRFLRKHRRVMLAEELNWFAFFCGIAFSVFDEPFALIATISSDEFSPIRKVAQILMALVVDFSIAGAIVYGTVPWISRRILKSTATPESRP